MESISNILFNVESFFDIFINSINNFGILGYATSVFLAGETAIVFGFLLAFSGQGMTFFDILAAALIGTVSADIFWFFIGRYFPKEILPDKFKDYIVKPVDSAIKLFIRDRIFLSLIFLKFLIGIRLVSIIHIGKREINFFKFLFFDIIGTSIYLIILFGLIYLLNNMFAISFSQFHNISIFLTGFLLICTMSIVVRNIIFKK